MKFRAERNEFADAVSWAAKTAGARVTMPVLSGIQFDANDGRLTCRATDLEVSAEVGISVKVEASGQAVLPGRLLAQLVTKLPDAPVEVSGESDRIEITCGNATFHVRGMPAADFPELPGPAEDAPRGSIKIDDFVDLVAQVASAASTDEARPVLTGVKVTAGDSKISAIATDSYRLAMRTIDWEHDASGSALIPARALKEAAKAASEVGGEVGLVLEEGQTTFLLGDRRLTTRQVEGSFPDHGTLVPEAFDCKAIVDRDLLTDALQRVAVVALGQSNTPVKLAFGDGSVALSAASQEVGDASESLPAEIDGDDIEISFNPTFLLAGIEATGTEHVRIELSQNLKPAVIKPHAPKGGTPDDYTYVLMPMRTN